MTVNEIAVRAINFLLEEDLNTIEAGGEPAFLYHHEETGALVPLDWVTRLVPEWKKDWGKFMHGESFLEHGFFVQDVKKFLHTRLNKK